MEIVVIESDYVSSNFSIFFLLTETENRLTVINFLLLNFDVSNMLVRTYVTSFPENEILYPRRTAQKKEDFYFDNYCYNNVIMYIRSNVHTYEFPSYTKNFPKMNLVRPYGKL